MSIRITRMLRRVDPALVVALLALFALACNTR
jgi:hypothetical protein